MTNQERAEIRRLWSGRVEEFRASGLGAPQWCAQHGYNVKQLHYWLHRLPTADATASASGWLPVPIVPEPSHDTLGVRVGSAVIEVRMGFDADLLRAVVRALA